MGGGPVHVVAHHLEHAVEIGGDDDVDELLRHLAGLHALTADDLHVLVGVLHLNVHQFVQETGKPGAVGPVQQEAEYVEVVIDVVQQVHLVAGGVPAHLRPLGLVIQLVETLLNLPEHGPELVHHRLHKAAEQALFIPKAGVDGPGAGARLLGNGPQGCVQKPLGQELLLGALQNTIIDAGLLLRHTVTFFQTIFITMFYNDVLNIARDIPFVKPCAGKKDAVSFRHCVPGICSFAMRYLCGSIPGSAVAR